MDMDIMYKKLVLKEKFDCMMEDRKFIDAETNELVDTLKEYVYGLVYICKDYAEFGWFKPSAKTIMVILNHDEMFPGHGSLPGISREALPELIWSNKLGYYIFPKDMNKNTLLSHKHIYGQGNFPYRFPKHYEAVDSFHLFNNAQTVLNPDKVYPLSHHLKYTFGVEFETSMGYIPQEICFRDGLIPLRDGSISGIEYSTVVLEGNKGLALLEQQLESLRKYTKFNKECALHFHFGGYPVSRIPIYALYCLWYIVENDLSRREYIPRWSFHTREYKANGKDYCKKAPLCNSFEELYQFITNRKYYGSLTQPHPADLEKRAKWNIKSRYYGLNLVNMLCYNGPKTVEFRFLRPSFNLKKITLWMYIFNAILIEAERLAQEWVSDSKCPHDTNDMLPWILNTKYHGISNIIERVYGDPDIVKEINEGLNKLKMLTSLQTSNGDFHGGDTFFEDELFV